MSDDMRYTEKCPICGEMLARAQERLRRAQTRYMAVRAEPYTRSQDRREIALEAVVRARERIVAYWRWRAEAPERQRRLKEEADLMVADVMEEGTGIQFELTEDNIR
jgi:hypothetical protein